MGQETGPGGNTGPGDRCQQRGAGYEHETAAFVSFRVNG